MSALGQKRTCAVQLGMSALGQKRTHASQQTVYSITSSQSCKNVSRRGNPSALAVLTLTASSNLSGDCAGKLPADSPLRIRSTYELERRKMSAPSGPYDIKLPSTTSCL